MIEGLKKWASGDPRADAIFLLIKEKFAELFRLAEILQGRMTGDLVVKTTATQLPHGLDRVPRGRFIARQSGNAVIWDGTHTKQNLVMQASAQVTVRLWVW